MNHFNAQRWSLWGMVAFGLGDSRSGTGGSRSDSKTNSGGRTSSPGESRSGGTSSKGSTSSGSTSKGSTGTSGGTGSTSNSRGGSVGFSGGGGEGGPGRSSGSSVGSRSSSSPSSSSSPGASRGGTSRGASVGSSASVGSTASTASRGTTSTSTSTGRQSSRTGTGGTIGGGLAGAAGLTGSGLADKGGRVTGGFDSGRFGDTPAASTGGRVTGTPAGFDSGRFGPSITAEKGGRVSAAATPSRPSAASVGRQSSKNGQYDNGGINAAQIGPSVAVGKESRVTNIADKGARVTSAVGSKIGNGLAGGYAPPTRSARDVEAKSMQSLTASRTPAGSPNYGAGFAASARAAEDQSLGALHSYDREVVGVKSAGPGFTQVERRDGTVETRQGVRASRNNNPGNLEYSEFSRTKGAVGTDGRFAVFSSPEQGLAAMEGLLSGPKYNGLSISSAVKTYAPEKENNSKKYAEAAARAAGVPTSTRIGDLNPEQRAALTSEMTRLEGNQPYSTTTQVAGTPRGVAPSSQTAKASRFGQTYLSAAPTQDVQPKVDGRLPGLAGIAPSFNRFDTTGLSKSVVSVAEAVRTAVPGASVISGYRSPERNARVGGAKKSQHMQGNAVDIDMSGWSNERRAAALSAAVKAGATGIGIYNGGTSLHVDTRPGSKAMWGGNPVGQYKGMSIEQAPAWSRDILSSWQGEPVKGSRVAEASKPAPALPAARTVADRPVASVDRFETKYLGKASVPTPTARPDQKPARSPVDKVLAGAIDVGVGLLPGVGTVAAVYGAAAPLLGLPSVGDMALSLRDKNQFDLKTQLRQQDGETGNRTEERLRGATPVASQEAPAETGGSASAASTAPTTFEEKYLAFSDPTSRLTPEHKWGGSGANGVAYSL